MEEMTASSSSVLPTTCATIIGFTKLCEPIKARNTIVYLNWPVTMTFRKRFASCAARQAIQQARQSRWYFFKIFEYF